MHSIQKLKIIFNKHKGKILHSLNMWEFYCWTNLLFENVQYIQLIV